MVGGEAQESSFMARTSDCVCQHENLSLNGLSCFQMNAFLSIIGG